MIYPGTTEELIKLVQDIIASELDLYDLPLPEKIQVRGKYNDFVPLELLRKQFIEDYLDFAGLQNDIIFEKKQLVSRDNQNNLS